MVSAQLRVRIADETAHVDEEREVTPKLIKTFDLLDRLRVMETFDDLDQLRCLELLARRPVPDEPLDHRGRGLLSPPKPPLPVPALPCLYPQRRPGLCCLRRWGSC